MIPPIPPLPTNNLVKKTGDTMSGDLEFSGSAALTIASNAYAFKYSGDADAGLFYNATDQRYEFRDHLAARSFSMDAESGVFHSSGFKRVSTQYDKTNTTLGVITGLSVAVVAGLTYRFRAVLHINASAIGGHKIGIGSVGVTATNIIYQIISVDNGTMGNVITARQTAMNVSSGQAGATTVYATIDGLITVNAGGNLSVLFAQNAANGTSSVLVGSTFEMVEIL